MYATETVDTVIRNLARGDPKLERLIRSRAMVRPIPPEYLDYEMVYKDLPPTPTPINGGKHAHRRKSMSKCKSKKTRRTRNTRKRLRNYH